MDNLSHPLSFNDLSLLWKKAGFRSNTKVPAYLGAYQVQFDDLTFQDGLETKTVAKCVVDFINEKITDEQGRGYGWTPAKQTPDKE